MPKPSPPTVNVPITPLDPLYIPFTTIDPDGSEITTDEFPQKESGQYRNIIETLRAKLIAGNKLFPEAFAFLQTDTNLEDFNAWTVTDASAPTDNGTAAGSLQIQANWNVPTDQGQAGTIGGYEIQYSTDLFTSTIIVSQRNFFDVTTARIIPLAEGTYSIRIAAINENGTSPNFVQIDNLIVTS